MLPRQVTPYGCRRLVEDPQLVMNLPAGRLREELRTILTLAPPSEVRRYVLLPRMSAAVFRS